MEKFKQLTFLTFFLFSTASIAGQTVLLRANQVPNGVNTKALVTAFGERFETSQVDLRNANVRVKDLMGKSIISLKDGRSFFSDEIDLAEIEKRGGPGIFALQPKEQD